MYSAGRMKLTRTIGWRNSSISPASGTFLRRVDLERLAGRGDDLVGDVRRRLHQVDVGLLLEPLLHDLHVQQAQEAAAKAEAQGVARLRLEVEAGVVDRQLVERVAQLLEVLAVATGYRPQKTIRFGSW